MKQRERVYLLISRGELKVLRDLVEHELYTRQKDPQEGIVLSLVNDFLTTLRDRLQDCIDKQ